MGEANVGYLRLVGGRGCVAVVDGTVMEGPGPWPLAVGNHALKVVDEGSDMSAAASGANQPRLDVVLHVGRSHTKRLPLKVMVP